MPVLNSAMAAAILKKTMPHVKIVLFTLHADDMPKTLHRSIGIDLLVPKTDDITKLPERLAHLLADESPTPAADATSEKARTRHSTSYRELTATQRRR